MSKDIYVVTEQVDNKILSVGLELLGEANNLAADLKQNVVAILLGANVASKAKELIACGANEVIVAEHEMLKDYTTEPYTKVITQIIKDREPEIVLFSATSIGRDLAPRISARIKTGLTADCTALCIDPKTKLLRMTRPAFGGNLMAVILCKNHRPQMATIRPGVMEALEKDKNKTGIITQYKVDLTQEDCTVKILEVLKKDKKQLDITKARVLISGGRGIMQSGNFSMLKELAEELDGEISASRAAVDSGWIDKEHQVGQTGKTVKPELYLACGISGAIQHVAGMENANLIIAINKNESAPIFDVADLGIVGDVCEILPLVTEEIKKVKDAKEAGELCHISQESQYCSMENILYHTKDGIAYLVINRPQSLNALNIKTLQEINQITEKLEKDTDIKALIIRGAGRAFVAGADISEMQDMDEKQGREISKTAQEIFSRLHNLPQIVIGAINGFALGGGNELAMACDIRIASERAKFGQPEVNLGVLPGFGGTQRLSRIVGKSHAKQLIFSADMISAEEAYRIGLVSKVVAPQALLRTARDLAMKIMSKGMQAVRLAKRAINEGANLVDIEEAFGVENEAWTECFKTYDQKEGMSAFVEKRKAVFKDF